MNLKNLILILFGCLVIGFVCYWKFDETGRAKWNAYWHKMQKVDDRTLYKTKREVENTARAMNASYKADVATYNEFKNDNEEVNRTLAKQAKLRAIKTASVYNEYILKNSYVWEDNIPNDIDRELSIKFE
jgi:hypothetical protein